MRGLQGTCKLVLPGLANSVSLYKIQYYMAKLIGPFKFRGKLDDVCGRQTEDGIILQATPGPRREQVLSHPRFKNTRRNAQEFGGAIAASTLLRRVLGYMVCTVKHAKLVSHMNKKLHAVALSDTQSGWGDRHVNKGNIHLLEGFDYNPELGLDMALPVKPAHTMDAATGRVQLTVPGGLVRRKRVFPKAATHFRMVSCAGTVNFDKNKYSFDIAESELLPLGKVMEALQLEHQQTARPGEVMLHTAGMVFYEVTDGKAHLLRGGALQIVEVVRVQEVVAAGTGTPTHMAKPHTCASVCVPEEAPFVRVVIAKHLTCVPCLPHETVRGIVFTVVEEDVLYEMGDDVTDDAVTVEADHFSVGVVDAMGVPLMGAVAIIERQKYPYRKKLPFSV
jgi:hypothetical protein